MASPAPTLFLVYNADGGPISAIGDFVHKLVFPATYPCSLCGLTYGPLRMRRAWRRFLDSLGLPVLFLYRDEFRRTLDARNLPLPAILLGGEEGPPEVLVSAADLKALPDLDALIAMVGARLRARQIAAPPAPRTAR